MHYKKKWNTSTKPYMLATSHHGPTTINITNLTKDTTATIDLQTIQQPNKWTKTTTVDLITKPFVLQYLTSMDCGKGLKGHATNWASMYTSEGQHHQTLLMAPQGQGKQIKEKWCYRFKCPHINYPEEYTGESGRSFGDWP